MQIRERIIDYSENEVLAEKWLRVKGEEKYNQFANILDEKGIDIEWETLNDLYRYDKRLLFKNFKYLSFFEEYIRAIIVNNSQGGLEKYNKLQGDCLLQIMRQLVKLDRNVLEDYFRDVDDIKRMFVLNDLRNQICHNKIILQLDDPQNIMETFYSVLPDDYCENYKSKINGSIEDLSIPKEVMIILK